MKNETGIWIDKKQAFVIKFKEGGESKVLTIDSEIEDYHVKGGARSKSPWGPMDKVSESKYLEREKHQKKQYFEKISDQVWKHAELYIFGPAQTKEELGDHFKQDREFKGSILAIESADSMTTPQKVARVRDFFKQLHKN